MTRMTQQCSCTASCSQLFWWQATLLCVSEADILLLKVTLNLAPIVSREPLAAVASQIW